MKNREDFLMEVSVTARRQNAVLAGFCSAVRIASTQLYMQCKRSRLVHVFRAAGPNEAGQIKQGAIIASS